MKKLELSAKTINRGSGCVRGNIYIYFIWNMQNIFMDTGEANYDTDRALKKVFHISYFDFLMIKITLNVWYYNPHVSLKPIVLTYLTLKLCHLLTCKNCFQKCIHIFAHYC